MAVNGFNYSLTESKIEKVYIYFKIVDCDEKKAHICFFKMLKDLFLLIYENKFLTFASKRRMIRNLFESFKEENEEDEDLMYIFSVLDFMSK